MISEIKSRLNYNPITGIFTWKRPLNNFVKPGDFAGTTNEEGYIKIKFNNKSYGAHQIAWAFVHDYLPVKQIDHINGNRSDNRICNLRLVDQMQNSRNMKRRSDNVSGVTGVHWLKCRGKWIARINHNKRKVSLGYHKDFFEAVCARKSGELKYNYHENHGKRG